MSITDYRTYILSAYEEKKKSNPSFSLRAYARFLELSPSTLSEILNRHHTLSTRSAKKVIEKLKMGLGEATEFMNLVQDEISFRKKAGSQVQESKKMILKIAASDRKQVKQEIEAFLLELFAKYHNPNGSEDVLVKDLLSESMLVISSKQRSLINNTL